jgi:multidrug resistance efflux pump
MDDSWLDDLWERKRGRCYEKELKFIREEFASQIRLLELALQDAQSKAETAKQNARRIEQLQSNRVVSQEEAEKARQSASSAQSSVDQIVTLLDLYRKADPAKPAPTAATDDKSPQATTKPKQGEGQPR